MTHGWSNGFYFYRFGWFMTIATSHWPWEVLTIILTLCHFGETFCLTVKEYFNLKGVLDRLGEDPSFYVVGYVYFKCPRDYYQKSSTFIVFTGSRSLTYLTLYKCGVWWRVFILPYLISIYVVEPTESFRNTSHFQMFRILRWIFSKNFSVLTLLSLV